MPQEEFVGLSLQSEREIAETTLNKVLDTAWILLSLFIALSLVYLSGASYRDVIAYAIAGPIIVIISLGLFTERFYRARFLPAITYLAVLPFLVDQFVTQPWISYGLVMTIAGLSASIFLNNFVAGGLVIACAITQYIGSAQRITGISDYQDNLLLNSYFSTLWILVTGFGTIYIARRYVNYCDKLDVTIAEIEDDYWDRSREISQLNLRDHINLKLHGTILNTLIFAQKMPHKISSKELANQLQSELDALDSDEEEFWNAESVKNSLQTSIGNYEISIGVTVDANIVLQNTEYEILLEVVRETVLNIVKHTSSKAVSIHIGSMDERHLHIRIIETLSGITQASDASIYSQNALQSKSLARLLDRARGTITVEPYGSGRLVHSILMRRHRKDLNIMEEVGKLRAESLFILAGSASMFSVVYGLLACIGFLIIGASWLVTLILLIIELITGYLFYTRRYNPWLSALAMILSLIPIPYALLYIDGCDNLQYFPWVFNSILGCLLFSAFSARNRLLKWLPGFVLTAQCLIATQAFPRECQSLFNGSTPGVVIILILTRYLTFLRQRNLRLDALLQDALTEQSAKTRTIQDEVSRARTIVIDQVRELIRHLKKGREVQGELTRIINLLRVFLLTSEYFDLYIMKRVFEFSLQRSRQNLLTTINVYISNKNLQISTQDVDQCLRALLDSLAQQNVSITFNIGDDCVIAIGDASLEAKTRFQNMTQTMRFRNLKVEFTR